MIATNDLTFANLTMASEYKWSKEYEFRKSDHFPIIIKMKGKSLPNNCVNGA